MEKHFKQLIIARRDLNMLAAQVSSAFLIEKAKELGMIEGVDYFPIVEEHGVQTLILGAFEWNPEIVAELFMVFNRVLS